MFESKLVRAGIYALGTAVCGAIIYDIWASAPLGAEDVPTISGNDLLSFVPAVLGAGMGVTGLLLTAKVK